MERLKGLIPAVFTPMKDDQSLNLEQIFPFTEQLIQDKSCGFYVCGSTGEGPMLTTDERKIVTETFIKAVDGRIPIIVQVGHQALHDAADLAKHAQSAGADAIAAVPPNYFDIDSMDVLVECMSRIAAGAPNIPFYYYHIPILTKVDLDMYEFLTLASSQIPTIRGIKYTAMTVFGLQECVEFQGGKFEIFYGCDEQLLYGLTAGVKAAVGSTYNFATPLYNKIIEAFDSNDIDKARQLQALSIKMIRTMVKYGAQPAFKAVMKMIGAECGPNRLPHDNLSVKEISALKNELDKIGFFDWGR